MSDSPSEQRNKRRRIDTKGRFAALARLKDLKGSKNKYEVSEMENVYDEVDEEEYSRRVLDRAATDWIDDDGTGYVEDGREIFDEDEEEVVETKKERRKSNKRQRELDDVKTKQKGTIKNFLNAGISKKKESTAKSSDDNILADILGELESKPNNAEQLIAQTSNSAKSLTEPSSVLSKVIRSDAEVYEYMQNFGNSLKKPIKSKTEEDNSDDEIIDKVLKQNTRNNGKKIKKEPILVVEEAAVLIENEHIEEIINPTKTAVEEPIQEDDVGDITAEMFEDIEEIDSVPAEKKKDENKTTVLDEFEKNLLAGWDSVADFEYENETVVVSTNAAEDDNSVINSGDSMKMWMWDAWADQQKRPGEIFLFGKVLGNKGVGKADYQSICVQIENVEKCLFLLPREHELHIKTNSYLDKKVTFKDVEEELNTIAIDLNITCIRSRQVMKNFAFTVPDIEVPENCKYLEVRYNGKFPSLDPKKKYRTISHIFGTNTNPIENFLLERKIKGPSWLTINKFKVSENPLSWCKLQIVCPDVKSITVLQQGEKEIIAPPPPLVLCTINVRSILNPNTMKNEIVMISCLINNKFSIDKPAPNPPFNRHFCGITRPQITTWPFDITQKLNNYKSTTVKKYESERSLLSWFSTIFQNIDPDMIVTHDGYGCQLDLICNRMSALKVPYWSRIGRLKMSSTSNYSRKIDDYFTGRMICDIKLSAEELIKSRSYDLDTLCKEVLKIKDGERKDIPIDDILLMYEKSDTLLQLVTLTMQDCSYILRLMCDMNVLPLALQITNIAGNLMSRTLQGGRSERNEFLLMHAFTDKNYLVPDKAIITRDYNNDTDLTQRNTNKKKAAYSGGLVLDPIKGFYDKYILLMDFNSLYPSIIQEYNICFTTILPPTNVTEGESDESNLPALPDSSVEFGILPRQIRRLVESRREVKKLMQNPNLEPELKMQYNIRQLALKLTANSMYGCLGFSKSRFYAQHLAALVTQKGRDILLNTKTLVQKLNYTVIYGDTDSIMINTNSTDFDLVNKIGLNIKQMINKTYRNIELDIDGIFKYLLLLKKKKYASVMISRSKNNEFKCHQEHKGLDIVRRDWSKISGMIGKLILDEVLCDKQMDDRITAIYEHLAKVKENLNEGIVPLQMLEITKQLTRPPTEYNDAGSLPHVQVALRMNKLYNRRFKKGDMISYIICLNGSDDAAMKRAYHIDEIKMSMNNEKALKIDVDYYLAQQIHPVVSRLIEPIEGIDSSCVANSLGLDPKKYKSTVKKDIDYSDTIGESIIKTNAQKYRLCEKFRFICIGCKELNIVAGPFKPDNNNKAVSIFLHCSNTECTVLPEQYFPAIKNSLTLAIRNCIQRFYTNWLVCDDPMCNNNTRAFTHVTIDNSLICDECGKGQLIRQYSETELYTQLSFYKHMFDYQKPEYKNCKITPEIKQMYDALLKIVERFLAKSKYSIVNFSDLYKRYSTTKKTAGTQSMNSFYGQEKENTEDTKIDWAQFF